MRQSRHNNIILFPGVVSLETPEYQGDPDKNPAPEPPPNPVRILSYTSIKASAWSKLHGLVQFIEDGKHGFLYVRRVDSVRFRERWYCQTHDFADHAWLRVPLGVRVLAALRAWAEEWPSPLLAYQVGSEGRRRGQDLELCAFRCPYCAEVHHHDLRRGEEGIQKAGCHSLNPFDRTLRYELVRSPRHRWKEAAETTTIFGVVGKTMLQSSVPQEHPPIEYWRADEVEIYRAFSGGLLERSDR